MIQTPIVEVRNVSKTYFLGEVEVKALDFVVVAGPSGSGKSTLLHILGCIDKPSTGAVYFHDKDITGTSLENLNNLRLRQIGFVFQTFNLVPVLSAYENVELPLLFQLHDRDLRHQRVKESLEQVGIWENRDQRPGNLSGGQRQRVAIARAIAGRPSLIIADEPTASLDRKTAATIIDLLVTLNRQSGITVVLASHDPLVIEQGKRKIAITDGRIVPNEILQP
jgi:putative ABC transport system ATP-binding protein